jgi:excisionase family DNA binding protein
MDEEFDLLDAVQAADYLGVNRQRIYELARAGRIGQRVGALWVFPRQQLDAYKAARAQRPKGGRPRKSKADHAPDHQGGGEE